MWQESTTERGDSTVQAGPAGFRRATARCTHGIRRPLQCYLHAFTLAELLVSVGVLVLLVLLATQLLNNAATVTILGHKQMDADSQARQLLDRMAVDFAQMVKRSDVDYYVKSSAALPSRRVLQPGNDQIAFYSNVPGYYPSTGSQSPLSLVAYRVNSDSTSSAYNKMERLGKGLVWNAVSTTDTPVVFIPIPVASPLSLGDGPTQTPTPTPTPAANPQWPQAANMAPDASYEVVGSQVFRFEYYYLLKSGTFSDIPWDTTAGHYAVDGMQDVSAIVVDIAVIDPKSRTLLTDAQLATFTTPDAANFLRDYTSGMGPGQLRNQWQSTINGTTTFPRLALSGIRCYERFFYLSPPILLTP
jgi:type II secretory pathway component PulJ